MMYTLGKWNWIRLVVWLVIGLAVYFLYSQKNSRVQLGLLPGELDAGADSPGA
jgi:APA family basic amino acid/polyamine antiporter